MQDLTQKKIKIIVQFKKEAAIYKLIIIKLYYGIT